MTAFYDADSALDKIDRDVRMAQERVQRANEAQSAIALVRGKASSPHGEVTAEVDANGALTDLQLTDEALEDQPGDLARTIRDVVRDAQSDAGKRSMLIANDTFGEDSAVSAHLRGELEKRMH